MTSASFGMTGKAALITGSSRGIGRAIAEAFAEAGASVVVSSRKQDACDQVARGIRARGAEAVAIACNVSDREAIDMLVTSATERLGPIDILVGNAATNPYYGPLLGIEDRAWDKVMGTNVRSNLWLCNRVIPGMAERGEGAVILVSSIAAFKGDAALGAYAVSKAAEIQLMRSPPWNGARRGSGSTPSPPDSCERNSPELYGRTIHAGRRANGPLRFAGSASRKISPALRCFLHRVPVHMSPVNASSSTAA